MAMPLITPRVSKIARLFSIILPEELGNNPCSYQHPGPNQNDKPMQWPVSRKVQIQKGYFPSSLAYYPDKLLSTSTVS